MDWLSRPLVFYPTNDIEISDAQGHQKAQEVGNMWFGDTKIEISGLNRNIWVVKQRNITTQ